jgi:cobalamin biosynthesis protein CobD/CbiB
MDPLSLAAGLLMVATVASFIAASWVKVPDWFNIVLAWMIALLILTTTINGGISLQHMLSGQSASTSMDVDKSVRSGYNLNIN